ncbi:hypothetical protein QTN47_08495 [Danxiaibacter flavus]|uniref:Uncharacterized protein n=1 Tax=Danxiaibacter flavus TaxID=3049108 RepID=A0ABV3ZEM7_9BACT|nr:hypothetical protein QNM32_08495 [Chitinophagaceae bacterium DXS]
MKTKSLSALVLACCFLLGFVACTKQVDVQSENAVPSGIPVPANNWAFRISDAAFGGTIDTAYKTSSDGVNSIIIQGTDASGSILSIMISTREKHFIADAYTSLYGRSYIVYQNDTAYYASYKDSGSCSFEITKITDSVIEGNYKAVLLDKRTHKTMKITSGSVKAYFNVSGGKSPKPGQSGSESADWTINGAPVVIDTVYAGKDELSGDYVVTVESPDGDDQIVLSFPGSNTLPAAVYKVVNGSFTAENQVIPRLWQYNGSTGSYHGYRAVDGQLTVTFKGKDKIFQFVGLGFTDSKETKKISIIFTLPHQ